MSSDARPVVLLTNPIDPQATEFLSRHVEVRLAPATDPDSLRDAARGCDGIIVRAQLPVDLFEYAPRVRAVVRHGAGVDMIPIEAATAHRVPVANCPSVNATSVAQYAIAQMLAMARRLPAITARMKRGDWSGARSLADEAIEIDGATLGIVGLGAIGREVARIATTSFGMSVLGHQRRLDRIEPPVQPASLSRLLIDSDFLVLACPLTAETRHLLGAEALEQMKRDAFLINVARGAVIDQQALIKALADGRLAGAALDVFEDQPLSSGHPLLDVDRVLPTPHLAGLTRQSMRRMSDLAIDQMLQLLAGKRPRNLVNPEVMT